MSPEAGVGMVTVQAFVEAVVSCTSGVSVTVAVKSPPASRVSTSVPVPRSVTFTPPTAASPAATSSAVLVPSSWKLNESMAAVLVASARLSLHVPASPCGANVTVWEWALPAAPLPDAVTVTADLNEVVRLMSRTPALALIV